MVFRASSSGNFFSECVPRWCHAVHWNRATCVLITCLSLSKTLSNIKLQRCRVLCHMQTHMHTHTVFHLTQAVSHSWFWKAEKQKELGASHSPLWLPLQLSSCLLVFCFHTVIRLAKMFSLLYVDAVRCFSRLISGMWLCWLFIW